MRQSTCGGQEAAGKPNEHDLIRATLLPNPFVAQTIWVDPHVHPKRTEGCSQQYCLLLEGTHQFANSSCIIISPGFLLIERVCEASFWTPSKQAKGAGALWAAARSPARSAQGTSSSERSAPAHRAPVGREKPDEAEVFCCCGDPPYQPAAHKQILILNFPLREVNVTRAVRKIYPHSAC